MQFVLLLFGLSSVLAYVLVCYGELVHVRPGRHVCISETVKARAIPVRETYKKPVYNARRRNCSHGITSCPQFDVTYVTATKTSYRLQKSGSFAQDCCPGWTVGNKKREKGCMQPVCESGCGEMGQCIKPGVCLCPVGFQGENCDIDIDECFSPNHGCQHFCENTAGSYQCVCNDGFSLAEDGKTCIFCFTCTKQYVAMQTELQQIQQELKISRVLCRTARFETDRLKYRLDKLTASNDELERRIQHNTNSDAKLDNNMHDRHDKVNDILQAFESFDRKHIQPSTTKPLSMATSATTMNLSGSHWASETATEANRFQSQSFLAPTDEPLRESSTPSTFLQENASSTTDHFLSVTDVVKELTSTYEPVTTSPNTAPEISASTRQSLSTRSSTSTSAETVISSKLPMKSTAGQPESQYLQMILYDRFTSLSQQIGLLEERIGLCACGESSRG